ncbi:MAG: N-6 DNA methylase [Chloroflexi bacterium]|nr:N-6 DNA methylase [Chloroflexota bacterium]
MHHEADVEALFIEPLIKALGYPENRVRRKASIEELAIPRGARTERYRPDYILLDAGNDPVVIIDAKSPDESPRDYHYQVSGYALLVNQRYAYNPVRYCVVSNGMITEVYPWDRDVPILVLRFGEVIPADSKFAELRSAIAYAAFNQEKAVEAIRPQYRRPTIGEVVAAFESAHNMIWKKEKYGPTKAFYELAKLLFVKLRHDREIHETISRGNAPRQDQFYFTVDWIDRQPTANPVSQQLFREIQTALESEIRAGRKKRIFGEDEVIELRPSTIREVVRLLQEYDLHGIDEDLNGRMFETFLSATVRGKELGQFFTPRPVVKYMTRTARLRLRERRIPKVIDACCGSAGFLIEALAELSFAVRNSPQLTDADKAALQETLHSDSLYGIEANDEIGRIARLNMYLHGDGGSRVYVADSLDKELRGEAGIAVERQQQFDELRERLIRQNLQFDYALTNPPFSMTYRREEADERRILDQYEIVSGESAHSNVLFLERYRDLLRPESGELLTIIDDTVLNGVNAARYRQFILENFIIRQVVSLPFNTFFRAQANIKTSILHLRRKRAGENQGDVFMAIANNVGHDDSKRDTPHRDNLPEVANLFIEWDSQGTVPNLSRDNDVPEEPLGCPLQVFVVQGPELNTNRLDAFYYAPQLRRLWATLDARAKEGRIELRRGHDFRLIPRLRSDEKDALRGQASQYIEITSVTRDGLIVSPIKGLFEDLPTRAEFLVQTNDVLFAKNNSSRGTSVLVAGWFDGGFATSGFIGVRPRDEEEALILWSIFRSEAWRVQTYYLAITASQPEVRDEIFQEEMLIPWPTNADQRREIIDGARDVLKAREDERRAAITNRQRLQELLVTE